MRVLLVILVLGAISTGCTEEPAGNRRNPTAADKQIADAARKGVEWLLANQKEMSARRAFFNAHKLYRAVADDALARRLLRVARQRDGEIKVAKLATGFSSEKFLHWKAVDRQVQALIHRKCQQRPDKETTSQLATHIRKHGVSILGRLPLNNRVVAAFYLRELGVDCCGFYELAISDLRSVLDRARAANTGYDILDLYGLTHVVFTRSGYYNRYLDRKQFEIEVRALEHALARTPERPLNDIEIDITAEMLIARKLLRIPPDSLGNRLLARLAALQNADGSWGRASDASGRVHHTLVTTLALVEFAPEFRGRRNIRCPP